MNEALAGLCLQQNASEPLHLDQLVRKCCDCFEGDPAEPESKLPEWLFSASEWLTSDLAEMMSLFVALYQADPLGYGQKVCSAVGFWIRHFPVHFDGNPQLVRLLERLKRLTNADDSIPKSLHEELLDISTIPSYAWLRNPSTRNPLASKHVSLCFDQWSPEDIATSMSHLDHKVLSRVSVAELKHYVRLGHLSNLMPHLERSITIFNGFSGWVQATILCKSSAEERAKLMAKFVQVGKCLYQQNNFNTLMAVIGGITHSNISRLAHTHSLLPPPISGQLDEFSQLLSFNNNYAMYRRVLKGVGQRFRIPIMGIHLKDLIAFRHSPGMEHFEGSQRISERCLAQLAYLLSHFLSVDRTMPNFGDANLDLINTMKVLLDIAYDEEELYQLSLEREPKEREGVETGSRRQLPPAVIADWAKGVRREPDPESVDKHVKQMVDAIFKNYDADKDGKVRRSEFEQFMRSFNFIEPSTIGCSKAAQDSLISREEMEEFFVRKMRNRLSKHQHKWTDAHFLAPSICSYCKKMLWMRHGSKCLRCQTVAHQHCSQNGSTECLPQEIQNKSQEKDGEAASAGPSFTCAGISSWLNASSPRFTALGPSLRTPLIHQQVANGSAMLQFPSTSVDCSNDSSSSRKPTAKGIRRVRTSSSTSNSEGTSSREGTSASSTIQTARDNFGMFRSSFHRFLRKSKAAGFQNQQQQNKISKDSTENAVESEKSVNSDQAERLNSASDELASINIFEPRASLACEEVFEEGMIEIEMIDNDQIKEDKKGNG